MAADKTTATSENEEAEVDYFKFSGDLGYTLHRLRFHADAASALLHTHDSVDESDALQGVSYLLTDIAELASELASRLDDSSFKYVKAIERVSSAEKPSHPQH